MKILILCPIVIFVIAFFVLSGCNNKSIVERSNPVNKNLTPEQSSDLIRDNSNNKSFVILDVRTPKEYDSGHLAGSVNIDFHSDSFVEDIQKMNKEKTYLVYCRTGNRSGKTLDLMTSLGFKLAYNMIGGITEWSEKGFPVVKQ